MIRLARIINEYEKPFRDKYGKFLLPGHLKAMDAIKNCRSEHSAKMLIQCSNADCAHKKLIVHSCGHRHCPHCQNHETQVWIEKQLQKQVPAEYFMITFTLPYQFRRITWYKQRLVYSILFNCVWQTLQDFASNDRKLGGAPGAVAILHTHSRELNFHPHIHIVMPAATIDHKYGLWAHKPGRYLFNHKALAKVFRAKMLHAFTQNTIPIPDHYPQDWVVDCKQVGKGKKALLYLGQYLYRGVIREKDILSCQNGIVTFRFLNSKTKTWQYKTLPAVDFIWLVIKHVLPRGFRRARNFGFMHPNCKRLMRIIQWMFRLKPFSVKQVRNKIICPCCGSLMDIMMVGLSPGFHLPDPKPA
jgi:hypothetical protein